MAGYGKKKKHKKNRLAMFGIVLVVISLVCVLGYQTLLLRQKSNEYAQKLAAIEKQLDEQESRSVELEIKRIFTQTKQYIEQEAKAKLGLVNPNEIILIPNE